MIRRTQREQRLAAIGLLVLAVVAIWMIVIHPIVTDFLERSERRTVLAAIYHRDERAIGQAPSLARIANRQRRERPVYRAAGDAAAATAALSAQIGAIVTAAGGEMRSIEDAGGTMGAARVRADARLTPARLTDALARIENARPLLTIDAFTISANDAAQNPSEDDSLDVLLEVSASYSAAATR